MELLIVAGVFLYLCSCILAGAVAEARGRSAMLWGLAALFLFTPLLALVALVGMPIREREER